LITDAVMDVRGQSVTVQQTRRLSSDGNEMTVESVVNVQHGYTQTGAKTYSSSRDVFVRVKP
jgi:dTDP-4-dehydrorhamnose 3,5-epimerase-like enzyme